jgi:hypothetical protein
VDPFAKGTADATLQNMRKVGNLASNKIYNPQNKKPAVPLDADEADSAMERFIRVKYTHHAIDNQQRHHTGSTESDETPPPLPPKTPSRFGLRSASSIFPLSSKAKREAALRDAASRSHDLPQSPARRNKASQVFGASVGSDDDDDQTRNKLMQLRDMGFADEQRNAMVLKGVHGNVERAIESLIRLGERGRRSPLPPPSSREETSSGNRAFTPVTPVTPASSANAPPSARGITASNNPFDMPPAQPQSSQSTGTLQNKNPYLSANPFGIQQQSSIALDQALQNLSLAPSQPLFPHHTGGIPAPQQDAAPFYQQSMSPPVPALPSFYQAQPSLPMSFGGSYTYPQPAAPQQTGMNPIFAQQVQRDPQAGLTVNTTGYPGPIASNPFTRSPTSFQTPTLMQIPEQAQTSFFNAPAQPSPQPLQPQPTNNPFFSPPAPVAQPAFQPGRPDKASIMALYGYPQLAPAQPMPGPAQQAQVPQASEPAVASQQTQAAVQPQLRQEPSAPEIPPTAGSKNPFLNMATASPTSAASQLANAEKAAPKHNVSRDSIMALGLEWTNGRHSPDAFASLSSKNYR